MPRGVLIVEDDEGVASLLSELCAELGAPVRRARGGSEALALLREALPDVVLLDLVLAELDGFQVASGLRALPGGEDVALLVISGVYKKLPDAFQERFRPRHFAKPFEPAMVREAVREAIAAADAREGIERGRLVRTTPAALFAQFCEEKRTGLLEVATEQVRRRLWWQDGHIRFAQSNLRHESAGGMQVGAGRLRPAAFDRAIAHARQAKVPLYEALAATRAFTPAELAEALQQQTEEVSINTLGMFGGEWTFTRSKVERQPEAKVSPVSAILEHARRQMSPAEARLALARMGTGRIARSPLLERELDAVRALWPGESVLSLAAARPTLPQWLARAQESDLPLAWALATSRLVRLESAAGKSLTPGGGSPRIGSAAEGPGAAETRPPPGARPAQRSKDGLFITAGDLSSPLRLGETLLAQHKPAQALDLFREALARNPEDAESHAAAGYALYLAQGSAGVEEAREYLRAALERAPELASAYFFLGVIARDEGHEAEAVALFERAVEIDPKYGPAEAALTSLRRPEGDSLLRRLFGRRKGA